MDLVRPEVVPLAQVKVLAAHFDSPWRSAYDDGGRTAPEGAKAALVVSAPEGVGAVESDPLVATGRRGVLGALHRVPWDQHASQRTLI